MQDGQKHSMVLISVFTVLRLPFSRITALDSFELNDGAQGPQIMTRVWIDIVIFLLRPSPAGKFKKKSKNELENDQKGVVSKPGYEDLPFRFLFRLKRLCFKTSAEAQEKQ